MIKKVSVLVLLAHFTFGQTSTLFEISKEDNPHKSYLFGTVHLKNDRVFNFNDSLFHFMDQADKVYFELNLDEENFSKENLSFLGMSKFSSLDTSKIVPFLKRLTRKIITQMPPKKMAARINNDIIPALEKNLQNAWELKGDRALAMDQFLTEYSKSKNMEIHGIENVGEQLDALIGKLNVSSDFLNKKTEKKIIKAIKYGNLDNFLSKYVNGQSSLIESYEKQDLSDLDAVLKKSMSPEFYSRILVKRNDVMFERTKIEVENHSIFIAVGSGHLVGENGLLNQYKSLGYSIRPVDLRTAYKRSTENKNINHEGISFELPEYFMFSDQGMSESGYNGEESHPFFTYKGIVSEGILNLTVDITNYETDSSELQDINEEYLFDDQETDEEFEIGSPPPELSYEYTAPEEQVSSNKNSKSIAKAYVMQVIENVDYKAFFERVLSTIKPPIDLNLVNDSQEELNANGYTFTISENNLFGQKTKTINLSHLGTNYSFTLSGEAKAVEGLDLDTVLHSITLN